MASIVRLLSPGPWLVCTTKVYPGVGADIVMESISLIAREKGEYRVQACDNVTDSPNDASVII